MLEREKSTETEGEIVARIIAKDPTKLWDGIGFGLGDCHRGYCSVFVVILVVLGSWVVNKRSRERETALW